MSAIWAMWGEEWALEEKVSFNGYTRQITVHEGVTDLDIQDDVYSAWKRWVLRETNSRFFAAMRTVGGDPTGPTRELGASFFLINGWNLQPASTDHTLRVTGNIYTDPFGDPVFDPSEHPHNIFIEMSVSNLIDVLHSTANINAAEVATAVWDVPAADHNIAATTGAVLNTTPPTPPTASAIASAVWDEPAASHVAAGSMGLTVSNIPASAANLILDLEDAIEAGMTVRQALRLMAAALVGEVSGAPTGPIVIRNAVADSKARITATVDANGNRLNVVTDST